MSKSNKQKALEILEDRPYLDAVYMNSRGEFFTEEYLADNSNQGNSETKTFTRPKKKSTQKTVGKPEGGTPSTATKGNVKKEVTIDKPEGEKLEEQNKK